MNTKAKVLIGIMLSLILKTSMIHAGETPMSVFVLAGQSNMAGQAHVEDLPDNLKVAQADVLYFQKGEWIPLEPGKVPGGRTFGPEVTFGEAMAKHFGGKIGIIKVALGGTNLANAWSPKTPASLYARLRKQVESAHKSRPIVIIGMLWVQGAADAKDEDMAKAYQKNLENLIATAKKDFDADNLLFVCGRSNAENKAKFKFADMVKNAQESVKLPGYKLVVCNGIATGRDNLHYNAEGQIELGRRCADTMIGLMKSKNDRGEKISW